MDFTFKQLSAPFPYEDIEWRAGATNKEKSKALALAYITSRAVMNRLDDVCGPHNWRDEYAAGPDGGVICGLSIRVGDEWITKWDGADNSQIEAVKGGLSDAFKRAAVKWGIGRYLYGLDGVWVECEAFGNTVKLKGQPKLPAWALPATAKTPAPAPAAAPVPVEANKSEDPPASAAMITRYKELIEQAKGLGLMTTGLPANVTESNIIELGKALKQRISNVEQTLAKA